MDTGSPPNSQSESAADYEVVDHTADWAVLVRGRDFAQLLLNAARAMNSLLVSRPECVEQRVERRFRLEAIDREGLLVEWLSELAYYAEIEALIFPRLLLESVTTTELAATVVGDRVADLQKHIKAVTYHNLEIRETTNGLEATVVFDV